MIEIVLRGTYEECQREALRLFGPAPVVEPEIKFEEPASVTETLNADTAAALEETAADAPETAQDAPETKEGETVAEAPEAPENAPEAQETAAPAITMTEARARMNDIRQRFGAKAVRDVLKELGYGKFTDVPSDKYTELMACCDAAENAGKEGLYA